MLHVVLACLCVAVLALVVVVTVLWRRVHGDRRLADKRADTAEGYRLAGLLRFGAIEAALRPCPRVHLDRLPDSWTRSIPRRPPDEDEVNPTFPVRRSAPDAVPMTLRSRK